MECDVLLVDMNSLVHGAARKATTPNQATKRVLRRLDGLFDPRAPGLTFRPRASVGLFSDGRQMPAPQEARCRRRRAFLLLVAGYICVAAAPSAADARRVA